MGDSLVRLHQVAAAVGAVVVLSACGDGSPDQTTSEGDSDATCPHGIAVFYDPGTPMDTVNAARAEAETIDGVTRAVAIDQDQAYDEFREMFGPDEYPTVTPDDLPPWVKVSVDTPKAADRVESHFEGRPGVEFQRSEDPADDADAKRHHDARWCR